MTTFKTIIPSLVLATALALGGAPALAQDDSDLAGLTPAERTQLEDQCRAIQVESSDRTSTESNEDNDEPGLGVTVRATPAYCASIGIV